MKTYITLFLFVFYAVFSFAIVADEYDDAIYQLNRGEFKAAIKLLVPLIDEGYAPAEYQLALIYLKGLGTPKNPNKAVELFTKAAEKNYPDAQFELANLYYEGKMVKKDLKKSFELTEKAAKKGLASAQYNLGVKYYNGDGVRQDYYQASKWYQKAADQNYGLAQYNLALMYYEGKGVPKSTLMSYVWNIIAARNGYPDAAKSRDMDEHKLSVEDIAIGREKANNIHEKIIRQMELKAKIANQKLY